VTDTKPETPTPPEAPPTDNPDEFKIIIDEIKDEGTKILVGKLLDQNKTQAAKLDELYKSNEKTKLVKYELDRSRVFDEIKKINPKIAEQSKEKHLNDLQIIRDTLVLQTGTKSFSEGAPEGTDTSDRFPIGFDKVKNEYIYNK